MRLVIKKNDGNLTSECCRVKVTRKSYLPYALPRPKTEWKWAKTWSLLDLDSIMQKYMKREFMNAPYLWLLSSLYLNTMMLQQFSFSSFIDSCTQEKLPIP